MVKQLAVICYYCIVLLTLLTCIALQVYTCVTQYRDL